MSRYARAETAVSHIRTTALIAGWHPDAGDLLAGAGIEPRQAAKIFRDALERVQ
jgi:hypothetical protein